MHEVSRQELYDLVWSTPMRNLCERFGVSDVALAKACKRANIPVPGRGYWAKKEAGKHAIKGRLLPRGLGMPDHVTIGRSEGRSLTDQEVLAPLPPPPAFEEDLTIVRARIATLLKNLKIPKSLTRAHPVVQRLLDEDAARKQEQLKQGYVSTWNGPFFDSPIGRRRLRMMNALFNAAVMFGGKAWVHGRGVEECTIQVGEQWVRFSITEVQGKFRRPAAGQPEQRPPSKLRIALAERERWEVPTSWEDEGENPLESRIQEIATELILRGEVQYREGVERHYQWRVELKERREEEIRAAEEARVRQEREAREKAERERVERLLGQATSLDAAERIRAYVEAVLTSEAKSKGPEGPAALESWAKWARAQADRIDPVINRHFEADQSPPSVSA